MINITCFTCIVIGFVMSIELQSLTLAIEHFQAKTAYENLMAYGVGTYGRK